MNITPLKRKVRRVLAPRTQTFRDVSVKRWELCAAEQGSAPPAIYDPRDLDRVVAVMEDTSLEHELARIQGGARNHAASTAYLLKDAELLDGRLYTGSVCHRLVNQKERLVGPSTSESIASAALACSLYGNIYFGHWMSDDVSLYPAAASLGTPIGAKRKLYRHETGYREVMGIDIREVSRVHCEEIVVIDDWGQNSYKRARYEQLRGHLSATTKSAGNELVMIGRGTLGTPRPLVNTEEVHEYLRSQGFVIIDPEKLTSAEIVEQTLGARIVLGVEGSHMVHGLYTMAEDGIFSFIQPPGRFNNVFKDYTDCLGMKYAFAVGNVVEKGFEFPLDMLRRFLDLIGV